MENNNKPQVSKLLHPVGLGKRVLSFIIDFTIALIVGVIVYATVGQKLIVEKSDYYAQKDAFRDNCVSSHLAYEFYCDECKSYWDPGYITESTDSYADPNGHTIKMNSEPISYTMKDGDGNWLDVVKLNGNEMHPYELYEDIIWKYFTDYLPNDPAFVGQTKDGKTYTEYYTPGYAVKEIFGIKPDSSGNPILTDSMYYKPSKDAHDQWDYNARPVVRTDMGDLDQKSVRDAIATYFNSSNAGLYVDALTDLKTQTIYTVPVARMNTVAYLALIPAVAFPSLVFFLIVPLCVPDGKTLGKLLLKLAVVQIDGFKAPVISKILRYVFVLVGFEILLVPYTMIALMVMMLYFAIGYMILVMSKTSQTLHDKLAKTIVVDAKTSLWFADEEAKQEYIETHPSSLAAKLDAEEKGKTVGEDGITRVLYGEAIPSDEEAGVLDLSTIEKFHAETDNITSFDEFENRNDEEPSLEEKAVEATSQESIPEENNEESEETPESDFTDEK